MKVCLKGLCFESLRGAEPIENREGKAQNKPKYEVIYADNGRSVYCKLLP